MKLILKILFTTIILLLSIALNAAARLDFIEEDLIFHLDKKSFRLDGDYWFCNNTEEDVSQQLYFPIPSDSLNLPAEKLSLKAEKPLPGQKARILSIGDKGFWFEITLPAKTILVCRISYKQKLKGNTATYVLLSTKSWGKPLEYVKYTLYTSKNIKLKSVSLPDPLVKTGLFSRKYTWEYKNYSPELDFIVEFE